MFSDPKALLIIAGALALAVLVTWIAARLVGQRIAKRSPLLARLVAALAAPAIALTAGFVLFRIDSAAHPGSDWPAMGLAGTILISQIMLVATIPTTWLLLRRPTAKASGDTPVLMQPRSSNTTATRSAVETPFPIRMTRDSVCMADDVDAPHEETFAVTATDTLANIAATVAASNYLPMPSDAWGWTIEAGGAVVAIRPRSVGRRVVTLQGDPAAVMGRDHPELTALYVRPGSPWRAAVASSTRSGSRGAGGSRLRRAALPSALISIAAFTTACQPGSVGPLEAAPGVPRGAPDVYGHSSALVMADGLVAIVSGSWTTRLSANHIDLRVTYRNDGRRVVALSGAGFAARRGGDRAEVTQTSDMTGVDLADARTDNDEARQILSVYNGPPTSTIRIRPGETTIVEATTSFTDGVTDLGAGQDVFVRVPVPDGGRTVGFRTGGGCGDNGIATDVVRLESGGRSATRPAYRPHLWPGTWGLPPRSW